MGRAAEKHIEAIDPHWDVIHIVNNHTEELRRQEEKRAEYFAKAEQRKQRMRRRRFRKALNNTGYFASGIGFLGMTLCGFARSYLLWGMFIAVSIVSYAIVRHTAK